MRRRHIVLLAIYLAATTSWGCQGCNQSQTNRPASEATDESSSAEEPRSADESNAPAEGNSLSDDGEASSSADGSDTGSADGGQEDQDGNDNGTGEGSATNSGGDAGSGLPSSTDTGNESTETSGAGPPPRLADPKFKTPESALRHATAQRTEAARQAAAQEYMDAYSGILEAWQSLQPHLSDPRCRQQSAELLAEMEIYGEQLTANSQPLIGKPLKIK